MSTLEPSAFAAVSDAGGAPDFQNGFITVESSREDPEKKIVTVGTGSGAVALVRQGKRILLLKQPRYAVGQDEWELPRGGTEPGEGTLDAALRCVEGKTGLVVDPATAMPLGTLTPDAEILTTVVALYVLQVPTGTRIPVGPDTAQWVDAAELVEQCLDGIVQDAFTCAAVLRARLSGLI